MDSKKFVEEYRALAREKQSNVDIALSNLLSVFHDEIEPLYEEAF